MSTESQQQEWTPLSLAQHFHNLYERCAPEFGYETRVETRAFNPETPNGKLMIAVCSEILRDFNAALAADRQRREQVEQKNAAQAIHEQPQRSEHQEWTADRLISYFSMAVGPKRRREAWEQLSQDINAALAAERQRREQAERSTTKRDGNWLDEMGACKVCDGEIPYGHTNNCDVWKLERQLLSALAVIEKADKILMQPNCDIDAAIGELRNIDPSILHQHDAKAGPDSDL